MGTLSLRALIDVLEKNQRVQRIARPVDRNWEPGCLVKWMFHGLADDQRFGLIFENVTGSRFPLATALLGSSRFAYATALRVDPDDINRAWVEALLKPIPAALTERAGSQEVVLRGDEVKLSDLPIPVWTPGKDAGPYITTPVMTKNADTGVQNLGVYRTQVLGDTSVVVNL
ncbi:MAG: carboxylase, partial [Candidatus Rokuibacteriota bacterium]